MILTMNAGPAITDFRGTFLSNFWPAEVRCDFVFYYPTVEHAYVASKTLDKSAREYIATIKTPGQAKRYGRTLDLRPDWEEVKLRVMEGLLYQKFDAGLLYQKFDAGPKATEEHLALARLLDATGDVALIETNTWNDTFWGTCRGKGENHLGKLLMTIRTVNRPLLEARGPVVDQTTCVHDFGDEPECSKCGFYGPDNA